MIGELFLKWKKRMKMISDRILTNAKTQKMNKKRPSKEKIKGVSNHSIHLLCDIHREFLTSKYKNHKEQQPKPLITETVRTFNNKKKVT